MTRRIGNRTTLVLGLALALGSAGLASAHDLVAPSDNPADEKSEQPVTDTWITTKVKTELATTKGVSSTDIQVETTNGIVTLIGVLDSQTEVDKAIATAKSIKGVKQVDSSGLKVR